MVLWAVALLSVVAFSLAATTAATSRELRTSFEAASNTLAARGACYVILSQLEPREAQEKTRGFAPEPLKEEIDEDEMPQLPIKLPFFDFGEEEEDEEEDEPDQEPAAEEKGEPEKERVTPRAKPYEVTLDQKTIVVSAREETGKIDLNRASPELMRDFLVLGHGVDRKTAAVICDSLADWRDGDNLKRLHGAENRYYQGLPQPYDCANRNLRSVGELRGVRGVTPEIFAKIATDLTLHGRDRINPTFASEPVLLALPGMSKPLARTFIRRREDGVDLSKDLFFAPLKAEYAHPLKECASFASWAYVSLEAVCRQEGATGRFFFLLQRRGNGWVIFRTST